MAGRFKKSEALRELVCKPGTPHGRLASPGLSGESWMIRSGPAPPGGLQLHLVCRHHGALKLPQFFCPSSAFPASCSLSSLLFLWVEHQAGAAQQGGLGRADQASSGGRVPFSCWGQACPWSLTCGLAIVKPTLLPCHLERPPHPTPPPILGKGVALCSQKVLRQDEA